MKRRKILMFGACAILCGMAVIGTYAYLMTNTEANINKFTATDSKNIQIALIEKGFEENKASSYLPGDTIVKDPTIKNTSKKLSVYAAIKTTYQAEKNGKMSDVSKLEFEEYAQIKGFGSEWELIESNDVSALYVYKKEVKANELAQPTLFQGIEIHQNIKVKDNGSLPKFNVLVEGYATQYKNVDFDEAKAALILMSNMTK